MIQNIEKFHCRESGRRIRKHRNMWRNFWQQQNWRIFQFIFQVFGGYSKIVRFWYRWNNYDLLFSVPSGNGVCCLLWWQLGEEKTPSYLIDLIIWSSNFIRTPAWTHDCKHRLSTKLVFNTFDFRRICNKFKAAKTYYFF